MAAYSTFGRHLLVRTIIAILLAWSALSQHAREGTADRFIRHLQNAARAAAAGYDGNARANLVGLAPVLADWKRQLAESIAHTQRAEETNRAACDQLHLQIRAARDTISGFDRTNGVLNVQASNLTTACTLARTQLNTHSTNIQNAGVECGRLAREIDRLTPQCLIPFYGIAVAVDIGNMDHKRKQLIASRRVWAADCDRLQGELAGKLAQLHAVQAQGDHLARQRRAVEDHLTTVQQQLSAADALSVGHMEQTLRLQLLSIALDSFGDLDDPTVVSRASLLVTTLDAKVHDQRPELGTIRDALRRQFND